MKGIDDLVFQERVLTKEEDKPYSLVKPETKYVGVEEVNLDRFRGKTSIKYWM